MPFVETGIVANLPNFIISLNRPIIFVGEADVYRCRGQKDVDKAVETLLSNQNVLLTDKFSDGLLILKSLKNRIFSNDAEQLYEKQRNARDEYHSLANKLFVHIVGNKINLKKSPEIGWIQILYPDQDEFLISYSKLQGLNSSWQWYINGIGYPQINQSLHPFYGTYFPTRVEHLDLFDKWLKQYEGKKDIAYDIGVGCGILTFMMLDNKLGKVIAGDINPNAVYSVFNETKNKSIAEKVELYVGNLFSDKTEKADIIVFNPPWIQSKEKSNNLDSAIFFSDDLFNQFFESASHRLNPNGRIVLIFSNLGDITGQNPFNPIEFELKNNKRFELVELIKAPMEKASSKTKRNQYWRKDELVELWILKQCSMS